MIVRLEDIEFSIPFQNIYRSEKTFITRIHRLRCDAINYIGEAKMSDRHIIILLAYFYASLAQHHSTPSPKEGHYSPNSEYTRHFKNRGEQSERGGVQFIYLCQGKARKAMLLRWAVKTFDYLETNDPEHRKVQIGDRMESCDGGRYSRMRQQSHQRKLTICLAGEFLQQQVDRREQQRRSEQQGYMTTADYSKSVLLEPTKVDYVFVQSSNYQNIMHRLFQVDINEIHIRRATIEYKKLDKYYHYRPESDGTPFISKVEDKLIVSNVEEKLSVRQQSHHASTGKVWSINKAENEFLELYQAKKQLLSQRSHVYSTNPYMSAELYHECYQMLNLANVGYLLACLLAEEKERKEKKHNPDYSAYTLSQFIQQLENKMVLMKKTIRDLRKNLLQLLSEYPPVLGQLTLETKYLLKVLHFFERVISWHDIFAHKEKEKNQPFFILRQKCQEGIELKSFCFDQRYLLEFLLPTCSSFAIVQNLAYPMDYIDDVFRFRTTTELNLVYDCPHNMHDYNRESSLKGLIVATTPSEEDLKLLDSEKVDQMRSDEKNKEEVQHYNQIVRAYGVLLHDVCEVTSDGVIVYFPSMGCLIECRREWEKRERIYEQLNEIKKIFEETQYQAENTKNVREFKKLCDQGKGAVFFLTTQSSFARLQRFGRHYSACIVFAGVPWQPKCGEIVTKIGYLKLKEHHNFEQALRTVNGCLNNCVSSLHQTRVVLFADASYNQKELKNKWFPFISQGNLSTLEAVDSCKKIFQRATKAQHRRMAMELAD